MWESVNLTQGAGPNCGSATAHLKGHTEVNESITPMGWATSKNRSAPPNPEGLQTFFVNRVLGSAWSLSRCCNS